MEPKSHYHLSILIDFILPVNVLQHYVVIQTVLLLPAVLENIYIHVECVKS